MKKIQTQVFKAALDIGNMTLAEFADALRDKAREVYSAADWVWLEEIRAGQVVVCVEHDIDTPYEYYRHEYTRNLEGGFEFGAGQRVVRVSSFVAAPE